MRAKTVKFTGLAAAGLSGMLLAAAAGAQTKIDFYYPVQVGGPVTQVIDGYVAKFEAANPGIDVVPIYSGNYQDTAVKSLTAAKSGSPPAVAVLTAVEIFTMIDEDVIIPISPLVTEADKPWLDGFMPAYMSSAYVDDQLWAVPFQRSTAIMLYNKEAFREAGLDPDKYPLTWDELADYAKKLTKDNNGTKRWGIGIPGTPGTGQWLFSAMSAQNGQRLASDDGTTTYFDDPKVVGALDFWLKLETDGVHPDGVLEYGTSSTDFVEGRFAMLWTTTGNLTNVRKNVKFDLGVAPLPGNPTPVSTLGGGNMYLFKGLSAEEEKAAYEFIKFMTSDEILADWSIQTGYVAPRDGSWDQPALKAYTEEVPFALVAKNQIAGAVREVSTYENARTAKLVNDAIAAALTKAKTPEQALKDAQAEAERILKPYR